MKNAGGRETFQDSDHVAAPIQSLQGHSDKGNSTLSFLPRNSEFAMSKGSAKKEPTCVSLMSFLRLNLDIGNKLLAVVSTDSLQG